jgi:hypothetical protein
MKTPEFYLDEVAKERGFADWLDIVSAMTLQDFRLSITKFNTIMKEAILRHSKEACEVQRKLCADAATIETITEYNADYEMDVYKVIADKQSILNAKSPIE